MSILYELSGRRQGLEAFGPSTWTDRITEVLERAGGIATIEGLEKLLLSSYPDATKNCHLPLRRVISAVLSNYERFTLLEPREPLSEPYWRLQSIAPLQNGSSFRSSRLDRVATLPFQSTRRNSRPLEQGRSKKLASSLKKLVTCSQPESVIDFRKSEAGRTYLVKWKGLSLLHASWQTEAQLKEYQDIIDRFFDPIPLPLEQPLPIVTGEDDALIPSSPLELERAARLWENRDRRWERVDNKKDVPTPEIKIVRGWEEDLSPSFQLPPLYIINDPSRFRLETKQLKSTFQPKIKTPIVPPKRAATESPQPSKKIRAEPDGSAVGVAGSSPGIRPVTHAPMHPPLGVPSAETDPNLLNWFPPEPTNLPFQFETPLESLFVFH